MNELSKASDERDLIAKVTGAFNLYQSGMTKALANEQKSGSGWFAFGWEFGNRKFLNLCADMRLDYPERSDSEIHERIQNRAQQNAAQYEGPARYDVGIQFWRTWVENNHGSTTLPQHAKIAYLACFGKIASGSEPDYKLWLDAKG